VLCQTWYSTDGALIAVRRWRLSSQPSDRHVHDLGWGKIDVINRQPEDVAMQLS